ncbi:MAG TPA: maleylacetoacetate isomerase [Burkholderiales bacterium]|nr:maleylacetoacetate isomerase [Burkholderiales bacterium]
MKLYTFFRSSTSYRLRIALAWKKLPYEPVFTSLPGMAHKDPAYLRLNPQGLVPALVSDAGKVYTQSMAMIEWLEERYPEPPLMPKDSDEKWYVRAVSQIIGCEMHPLNNVRVLKYLKSAYGLDDAKVNGGWYAHWIAEGFAGLEGFLAAQGRSGEYCLDRRVTMADVCLVPQVFNAQRFSCDLAPYPTVMRIFERCMALPAFAETQPSRQKDAA